MRSRKRSLLARPVLLAALTVGAVFVGRLVVRLLGVESSEKGQDRGFGYLEGREYVNLTTFRKNGEAVTTPIWFVVVDGRLYATTSPGSGKMKRIRNNARVVVAPATSWGAPRGESIEGVARDVENEPTGCAEAALHQKYRVGLGLIQTFGRGEMAQEIGRVVLEVRPAADAAA